MSTRGEIPGWLRELCERLQSDDNSHMLTVVNLNIRKVDRRMMSVLCEGLRTSTGLRSLNLTSSLIDRPGVMSSSQVLQPLLRTILPSQASLQVLHLSYNRLTGPLDGIGKALLTNPSLTELHMDHNLLDCATAVELAEGLSSRGSSLQVLQLSSNAIGDTGAISLAQALVTNKVIRTLKLNRNSIGREGGQAFVDALWKHKNTRLETLHLQNNSAISTSALGWIDALCQANQVGRSLLIDSTSPVGLAPLILAKASKKVRGVLYLLLRESHQSLIPAATPVSSQSRYKKARYAVS
jgi:Ran GTPase-activating protein (RanGAP) involved in mRNA processing and transport